MEQTVKLIAENIKATSMDLTNIHLCPPGYQRWNIDFVGCPATLIIGDKEIPMEQVRFTGQIFNKDMEEWVIRTFFPEVYNSLAEKVIEDE